MTGNHICGNYSMADGGGIGHLGLSNGGTINSNKIVFNQTFNQSANPTGGGIFIGGEASLDGSGLSPGTGSVTVTQNLIQGNNAEAGAGGGVRLYQVNGLDVSRSPTNTNGWNQVSLVNNMIANNVAAYAGGGVSLQDALRVSAINNTIANNDSTGTNQEALPAGDSVSNPQPAGVVSHATSTAITSLLSGTLLTNNRFSNATLINNIIWHNRSFCWAITGPTPPNNFGLFNSTSAGRVQYQLASWRNKRPDVSRPRGDRCCRQLDLHLGHRLRRAGSAVCILLLQRQRHTGADHPRLHDDDRHGGDGG